MIQIKSGFKKLVFEEVRFRKDLEQEIITILLEAAQLFFIEMINRVPVQTGMARASATSLAQWLSKMGKPVILQIDRKRFGPWADMRFALGPLSGMQEPPGRYGYIITSKNQYGIYRYVFDWWTLVEHWQYLEDQSHPKVTSAPWHAFSGGFDVFHRHVQSQMQFRLPGLKSYIHFTTMKIGGGD